MIDKKSKWIFGVSGIGKDAAYALSTIMFIFLTSYVGMSPLFVGGMFMFVRIWDAINDPIMGNIVQNTHSKWGKFRPWILAGTILNAIIVIFMFFNPGLAADSLELMIYVTVFYVLWGMSYTLMDIPFWSMIPALSTKKEDRESISALTRFFTTVGFAIISAPYLTFAALLGAGMFNPEAATKAEMRQGFLLLAIIVAVVFVISQVVMVTNVKEQVVVKKEEKVSLKDMFKLLVKNDQLMIVMIVVVVTNFVLYITSTMAFYYIAYNLGNESLYLPFIGLGLVVQLVSIALYTKIAKKLTRKQIFNFAILIQIFAFIGLFINAFIIGDNVILVFILGIGVFFGQGISMVLTTLLLADTVEYGELKTGKRSESTVFSVQTFVVKLATGLSMGVVGLGLELFGFRENPDSDQLLAQSDTTLLGISLMMFILPILGMLLSRYIFNKYHKLDESAYAKIVDELNVKKGHLYE
jgi:melibiose permease